MKSQADCFKALLEGNTLEHESRNFYRLIDGGLRTSRDPEFKDHEVASNCDFKFCGEFEIYQNKTQYMRDLEDKILQLMEELRILLNIRDTEKGKQK